MPLRKIHRGVYGNSTPWGGGDHGQERFRLCTTHLGPSDGCLARTEHHATFHPSVGMNRAVLPPESLRTPRIMDRTRFIVSIASITPTSGPRCCLRRLCSRVMAIATMLAVISAVVIAPASAEAATKPSSVETIAASLKADTIISDITTGKLSVDQLVDADLAAWPGDGSTATTPTRDQVKKEMTSEVQSVKDSGDLQVAPDIDVTASNDGRVSASASMPGSSFFSFKHLFKHWATITLDGRVAKIIVGTQAAVATAFICATPGVGALMCGLTAAIIGVIVGIYLNWPPCRGMTIYIWISDVNNTHC